MIAVYLRWFLGLLASLWFTLLLSKTTIFGARHIILVRAELLIIIFADMLTAPCVVSS